MVPRVEAESLPAAFEPAAVLFGVAEVLADANNMEDAVSGVFRTVCESLGWDVAALWRPDDAAGVLRAVAFWERTPRECDEFRTLTESAEFTRGAGLPGRVWATGRPAWTNNFGTTKFRRAAAARDRGLRAACAYPVAVGKRPLGVMEFFADRFESPHHQVSATLAAVGAQVGQFIRQSDLAQAVDWHARRAQQVIDSSLDAVVSMDRDGVIIAWNPQAERVFGWPAPAAVGRSLADTLIPARYRSAHVDAVNRTVSTGAPGRVLNQRVRIEAMHRDGHEIPVELTVTALEGSEDTFSAFIRDLSGEVERERRLADAAADHRRTTNELEASRGLLAVLTQGTTDIIFLKDVDGAYQLINEAGARFLGMPADEVVGRKDVELFLPEDAASHVSRDAEVTVTGQAATTEHVSLVDGVRRTYQATVGPYRDAHGSVVGTLGVVRDITDQKRLEEELAHRALHDELTGLPNRALFLDRLSHALSRRRRNKARVAVAFIDLDQFKIINDGLGHAAADAVLASVGRRLQDVVRAEDTVARIGGDEFTVLWEDAQADVAVRAQRLIEAFAAPVILVDGTEVFVRASIGVAVAQGPRQGADELLRWADAAMYRAKQRGRGRLEVFEPTTDVDPRPRLAIGNALAGAVDRGEFELHYQPIVNLRDGTVVAAEALLRWEHPAHGQVPPSEFIPLAEETGELRRITSWVVDEALRRCGSWYRAGTDIGVAINASAQDLEDDDFAKVIRGLLEVWHTPSRLVTIEVTETAIMMDPARTAAILSDLRDLGLRLSIDDFGTGYSSLAYLQRLPVHEIKIDRAFVGKMISDPQSEAIVRSTIELAHQLGLEALAEGVEDQTTLDRLRNLGCDRVQGYHVAHPMPPEGLSNWIRTHHPTATRRRHARAV